MFGMSTNGIKPKPHLSTLVPSSRLKKLPNVPEAESLEYPDQGSTLAFTLAFSSLDEMYFLGH
jgi:hypothetical protein